MSVGSQKLLEILQYLCFAGLILPGLAAIIMPDHRKKTAALFIIMIFMTVLSYIFYAGIMIFIVNIVFIFVFAVLYLLARSQEVQKTVRAGQKRSKRYINIFGYTSAVLFCSGLGYIISHNLRGYFNAVVRGREIVIAGLEDITAQVFGKYGIIVIILAAAALVTFTGFTVWYEKSHKDKEV